MPNTAAATMDRDRQTQHLYAKLEDRVLARDQLGASDVYYDLVRHGRPLSEMLRETARIHGPYTHVPYHERIDAGFINFVNNDHCLLSARATLHLSKWLPESMAGLPMAQTIWYVPTGLDIWNQKINKAPGHYARGVALEGKPMAPVVHWPSQEAERIEGSLGDKLGTWLTLVHRGSVLEAYRVFLGLMEDKANRPEVLAELVFAGLIDLQDRAFLNRSYTTGHKSYRARATVELGNAIGWDNARPVLYAGALDMAVGPRWYSTYEMACNCVTHYLEKEKISAMPYAGTTARERSLLRNTAPLLRAEAEAFLEVVMHHPEPAYLEALSKLLLAGKGPRQILDVLQIGAAQVLLETQDPLNFSIPQHCYEYCNTLGWFYDQFEHPQRLKLLYAAATFLHRNAHHQRATGDGVEAKAALPAGAHTLSAAQLIERVSASIMALDSPQALAWTRAYLATTAERDSLVQHLALIACRIGNDPHNQEIAQCLLEDYAKNRGFDRDRLLLACVQHTAVHRKYGDFMESSRRYGHAMGVAALQ
ncbi:MAG: hypothetical protein EXR36_08530 [Betaproteobacteria bacterium]|nr:hypothetical protein [Betaproteobacteria bacterium]